MINTMKIGTEFTFRRESFHFTSRELGGSGKQEGILEANAVISQWVDKLQKIQNQKSGGCVVSAKPGAPEKKYKDNTNYEARKVIFTFYNKRNHKSCEWAVNFDLDPYNIELQTTPVPLMFYITHKQFINHIIFDMAAEHGLRPMPDSNYGGGGHISIDWGTSFDGDVFAFLHFILLYTEASGTEELLNRCRDVANAPFLYDTKAYNAFKELCRAFNPATHRQNLPVFINCMHKKVYTEFAGCLTDKSYRTSNGVSDSDVIHYQAINLEHLQEMPNPWFEMRRFEAQQNVEELAAQVQLLITLIERAKEYANTGVPLPVK